MEYYYFALRNNRGLHLSIEKMAWLPFQKSFGFIFKLRHRFFGLEIWDVTGEDLIETRSVENGFHDCRLNLIGLGVNSIFFSSISINFV